MDIKLHGVIGDELLGGINVAVIEDQLSQAAADEPLTLRVNSPGGDVFEAVAISEVLADHAGPIEGRIDGRAASAATLILATIPKVTIATGGMYMIHNPWSIAAGDAAEFRHEAELLDKVTDNLVAQYSERSNLSADDVRAAMEYETWYSAEEAVEAGFVEAINPTRAMACKIPRTLGYKNAPKGEAGLLGVGMPKSPGRKPLTAKAWGRRLQRIAAELRC